MTASELKQARINLGLSQRGLADKIDMSKTMIGYMERGYGSKGQPVGIEETTALSVWCLLYESGNALIGDRAK